MIDRLAVWIRQRRDNKRKALLFDGEEGRIGVRGTVFCLESCWRVPREQRETKIVVKDQAYIR